VQTPLKLERCFLNLEKAAFLQRKGKRNGLLIENSKYNANIGLKWSKTPSNEWS